MTMTSARLVQALALAGAGARRSLLKPRGLRALSSAPLNPFEIDLKGLQTPASTGDKLTLDDAKRSAVAQQADAQRQINLLHEEMSSVFGEEVAEYGGDASSSSVELEQVVAVVDKGLGAKEDVPLPVDSSVQAVQPPAVKAARSKKSPKKSSQGEGEKAVGGESGEDSSGVEMVNVLLLQGPCSFMKGVWTGGDVERAELQRLVQELADKLKIVVKGRNHDSEKRILEMLLGAREDQVIVLCWNISLAKSPFVVHALELIQSRVIIVSPIGVEHGPLPANVVGVVSGFWNQSLSLAINAAANVLESNDTKKIRAGVSVSQKKNQQSPSAKGKKKGIKLTCNVCGEVGHIRRNCPKLPRTKE
ncbi:hypothetical protein PF003_g14606 [Phytophthora fragariae]|nr:hypothetical protein PF003_g14606 [Phytophthora fragariae]